MSGQAMYAGCGEKAFVRPAKPGLKGRSSFAACFFGAVPRASYCTKVACEFKPSHMTLISESRWQFLTYE